MPYLFVKHNILKCQDIVREQSIMILLAYINNTLTGPMARMFKFEKTESTKLAKHVFTPIALKRYWLFALSCSAPRILNEQAATKLKNIENVSRNKITSTWGLELGSPANFRWLGRGRISPPPPPSNFRTNRRSEKREAAIESSQQEDSNAILKFS